VLWVRAAGIGFGIHRLDAHQAHQPLYPLSADDHALTLKLATDRPAPGRWIFKIQFVDLSHQFQVFLFDGLWLVII
jgi:hypothetical protein